MNQTGRAVRRAVVLSLALLMLCAVCLTVGETTHVAHADTSLVYSVDPNYASGGVFARYGPHVADTNRVAGYGIYPNQQVKLLCGVTDGDAVGPHQNRTWHFVSDLNNTAEGTFWVNDRYIDSPNVANQLAPGEITCPNESSNPMQAAGTLPCTPVLVIGVRGSGEPYHSDMPGVVGFGSMLAPVANALRTYYGNNAVTVYGLPYQAIQANWGTATGPRGELYNSMDQGEELLVGIMMQQASACPNQIIDLVGYSQGAAVVNTTASDLSFALRSHIGGIVTFGDPFFNTHNIEDRGTYDKGYNGILGSRPELPQDIVEKAQSYCNQGDAVCNFLDRRSLLDRNSIYDGNYGHFQYPGLVAIQGEFFLEILHPKSQV